MRYKVQIGFAATALLAVLAVVVFVQDRTQPPLPSSIVAPVVKTEAVPEPTPEPEPAGVHVRGVLKRGETLASLLGQYGISAKTVHAVNRVGKKVFNFKQMRAGNPYAILISSEGTLENYEYTIDGFNKILISRDAESPAGFVSENVPIVYDIQYSIITGTVEDNLVNSLHDTLEPDRLAIDLSEIFAWDIDFGTDLRKGDSFEILIEERWLDGVFKKYGRILVAHFKNSGQLYQAHYFSGDKEASGYYDEKGRPLRRGFLSSPLRYKYISSRFSRSRLHPILKTRRPHLGVDYAAPTGTPVQAASDGTVRFAGRKGGFGKLIILGHPTGHETYYAHLSGFAKNVNRNAKVTQGEIIGYVGSTGLSTGPHLDYRVKFRGRFLDPLKLKSIRPDPLSNDLLAMFKSEMQSLEALFHAARYAVLKDDLKNDSSVKSPQKHSS